MTGNNFAQEAIRYWPLPGAPAADYTQHLRDTAYNYVGKPPGLPAATLLGAVLGRRIRRAIAR